MSAVNKPGRVIYLVHSIGVDCQSCHHRVGDRCTLVEVDLFYRDAGSTREYLRAERCAKAPTQISNFR